MEHHIAIIGVGPRGTYCFRRLAVYLKKHPLKRLVNIHLIEKSGNFGGGGIHSVAQPDYLLLNTIGSQITAFGDDDQEARSSEARKTLHGYLADKGLDIGPNDYPSRAQHGRYLADMVNWTEANLPPNAAVHRHTATAIDIQPGPAGEQHIVLDNNSSIPAKEVLLLTGHAKNRIPPGSGAEAWTVFAESQQKKGRRTSYVHLVYPIDEKTRHIAPGDWVYVIGMGLTAVDVVKTFTIGRGGKFKNGVYMPSGNEPFIILGSRLGLPYSARAYNQKTDQYKGKILLPELIGELKMQKPKIDFVKDLMPCITREMEYVYYTTLTGDKFGDQLLANSSNESRRALIRENVAPEDRFSWEDLEDPFRTIESRTLSGQPLFSSMTEYSRFVADYIRQDIAEAEKGNLTSPLKTAVDSVLRDLRDTLRLAVDRGGLTAASHRYLDKVFNRANNRIAVGPPVSSTRELLILAEMGIVSFSGPMPKLTMKEDTGEFFIESDQVVGSGRSVQHVLNGRIHSVDCKNDSSPLIQNLYRRGMIRNFVNADDTSSYVLGGLDITDDFNVINGDGQAHPHVCAIGIPIEGKFWFNAADARPDVNSNAIAQLSRWVENSVSRLKSKEKAGS
ncbi:FAD/NAD(P)-binding protein [Thermodesulfobacteriota bacterium]